MICGFVSLFSIIPLEEKYAFTVLGRIWFFIGLCVLSHNLEPTTHTSKHGSLLGSNPNSFIFLFF